MLRFKLSLGDSEGKLVLLDGDHAAVALVRRVRAEKRPDSAINPNVALELLQLVVKFPFQSCELLNPFFYGCELRLFCLEL